MTVKKAKKNKGGSYSETTKSWPGMPDETFPRSFGLIWHMNLVKSPQIAFVEGRENVDGDWTIFYQFKQTNQICYC